MAVGLANLLAPGRGAAQTIPDTVRWAVALSGPPAGAPLVSGDIVAVPLASGAVAAHRLSDGGAAWTTELAADQPLGGDGERVYVVAGEALHALNSATGTVAWRVAVAKPSAPPLAHAGWVIAAAGGDLLAIRAADGSIIWRRTVGEIVFRPALDGDLLVASLLDGRVLALDVQTGAPKWERPLGSRPTEPLAVGGRVYVGTEDKAFYTLFGSSGRIESRRPVPAEPRGRAAADERHVYFAAMDNVLYATDRGDGALEWKKGLTYRPGAGPVVIGDHVLVPARQVESLPVFGARKGEPSGGIAFPARLAVLPVYATIGEGKPIFIGVAGDLTNKWTMTLLERSVVPPASVQPLTALPGDVVLLPVPPPPPKPDSPPSRSGPPRPASPPLP